MSKIINMCPEELKKAIDNNYVLLIPVGTVEYHGSQLPLGTDLLIVEGIADKIDKKTHVVVAPSIVYSPNGHAVSGADMGTVDVSVDSFMAYVYEITCEYKKMGFKNIIFLVHHQAYNIKKMIEVVISKFTTYELKNELGDSWWTKNISPPNNCYFEVCSATFDMSDYFEGHGGFGETNAILALYPNLVKLENLTDSEAWWNNSAAQADQAKAEQGMDIVIKKWVEKISNIYK